ncbi:TAXI family TRAP transporter solute-binding subunit [Aeromonas sp. A-5]|uniref:TAXI family TRAP transporter solute-binding subunit n=1 Tax=Aeromonas ichthyocola TaxID=3367746 RepID=UPI0038EE7FEB
MEGEQVDKLLKHHPYYQRSRIAANLYPGQTSSLNNIGMSAELVALASLPDPIVRTVRDTLLARVKQFSRLHPALSKVTPEQLQAQTELPLHSGMSDQPRALITDPRAISARAVDSGAVDLRRRAASGQCRKGRQPTFHRMSAATSSAALATGSARDHHRSAGHRKRSAATEAQRWPQKPPPARGGARGHP